MLHYWFQVSKYICVCRFSLFHHWKSDQFFLPIFHTAKTSPPHGTLSTVYEWYAFESLSSFHSTTQHVLISISALFLLCLDIISFWSPACVDTKPSIYYSSLKTHPFPSSIVILPNWNVTHNMSPLIIEQTYGVSKTVSIHLGNYAVTYIPQYNPSHSFLVIRAYFYSSSLWFLDSTSYY